MSSRAICSFVIGKSFVYVFVWLQILYQRLYQYPLSTRLLEILKRSRI